MKYLNTRGHRSAGWILALSVFAFAFALPMGANAQWDVIYLNPRGATGSRAVGVDGGQQVGSAHVDGIDRASLWSGTAKSWVDLHPAGMASSFAYDVGGGYQVGSAAVDVDVIHAGLWSGTAASWVDLHPTGAVQSIATGVDGAQQVGYAYYPVGEDLLPRASLWSGTAASWVDLHPAGTTESRAREADGGYQVGYARVDVDVIHASLWNGDAGSWVDLHPAGENTSSEAFGVHGGQQVGVVFNNDPYRAALWSGTAESWVDLHELLPKQFESSMARGIWHDDTYTYVVGHGYNSKRDRNEALMWRADYSPSGSGSMHVHQMSVGRGSQGPLYYGSCCVYIYDHDDTPVRNAEVELIATGPTGGMLTGTTDDLGLACVRTPKTRNPIGVWCFEVTDVVHTDYTYDPSGNHVDMPVCESRSAPGPGGGSDHVHFLAGTNRTASAGKMVQEIAFRVETAGHVMLDVFDITGAKVATLIDGWRDAGAHSAQFDVARKGSGVYFAQLRAGEESVTMRLVVVR